MKIFQNAIQAWLIKTQFVIKMSWILSFIIHELLLIVI